MMRMACLLLCLPLLASANDADIRTKLATRLGNATEAYQREIRRIGNGTIEMEVFIASEIDPAFAPGILTDYRHYGDWMLKDINQPPSGGAFVTQLHSIAPSPAARDLLVAVYSFNVPLLKTERTVTFQLNAAGARDVFTVTAQSDEPSGALASARAELKIFPSPRHPQHSWIYVRGTVHLRSWLLYEALPEKVLARESGERIRILLDNFLREESRRRQTSGRSKSS